MSDRQTIFRVAHRHKPYSQLSNSMLQDKRLTYGQRGLLSFILSHPADWKFNMAWLLKVGGIGKDAAYEAIAVYRKWGYCLRRDIREKDGRITGWEYVFTDDPVPLPENPEVAGDPLPVQPEVVAATSGKTGRIQKKQSYKGNKEDKVVSSRAQARERPTTKHSFVRKQRAAVLLDDWELPEEWRKSAEDAAPALAGRVLIEAEKFAAYNRERLTVETPEGWRGLWARWWALAVHNTPGAAKGRKIRGWDSGPTVFDGGGSSKAFRQYEADCIRRGVYAASPPNKPTP